MVMVALLCCDFILEFQAELWRQSSIKKDYSILGTLDMVRVSGPLTSTLISFIHDTEVEVETPASIIRQDEKLSWLIQPTNSIELSDWRC